MPSEPGWRMAAVAALAFCLGAAAAEPSGFPLLAASPARIFFSDLESGPGTGGEGNAGAFVTLRGGGFGASRGTSTVTVGGGAVAGYRVWSDTRVVFQLGPGALTGDVVVTTDAGPSNGVPFTVRPGGLYFVSTTGSDSAAGSFGSPWRHVAHAKNTIAAGDTVYVRDGVSETAEDAFGAVLSIETGGAAGTPKALLAYPGATVTIGSTAAGMMGLRVPNNGEAVTDWVVGGIRFRGEVSAFDIGGTGSSRWRVVGNDISCPVGDGQTGCFAASQASHIAFLGNQVHDISQQASGQPSKQYHAVYFTTDTNHVEVGWNHIHDNLTCRALQFHSSPLCAPACGPTDTTGFNQHHLEVHDNLIHGDACDGINFATVDPSQGPVRAYNNVIYAVGLGPDPPDGSSNYAGIYVAGSRNSGTDGTGDVEVFNNTLYDCGARADSSSGAFARGTGSPGLSLLLTNNVVYALAGEAYLSADSDTALVAGSRNLWFGAGAAPAFDLTGVETDPLFSDRTGLDFHLQATSPALDVADPGAPATDFDGVPRPQGAAADLGAFELPVSVPAFSIADVTVTEGDAGPVPAVFTVTLSPAGETLVTVDYATSDGSATAGADYTAGSGTLSFAPGSTTTTLSVPVLGDTLDEADETFSVVLSSPQGGAGLGDGAGTGGIGDDDPSPWLAVSDVSLAEGSAGGTRPALFSVSLSQASGRTASVEYATASGTATAGSDFWTTSGVLSFPAGTTLRTVSVPIAQDRRDEPDESFSLVLSSPVAATLADDTASATILDDDPLPSLSVRSTRVREGATGSRDAVFVVRLTAPSGRAVSVDYATSDGTASAGSDYTATAGTLTLPPGTLNASVRVEVQGDRIREGNQTLFLTLSGASGATLAVTRASGTIVDDDGGVAPSHGSVRGTSR